MKRLIGCLFVFWSALVAAQNTPGIVSFTVKTVDDNKDFAPKHIMAIWVETDGGKFVKTLKVQAARRIKYLYTWNARSGGSKVDAITGPTLPDHQPQTVIWNCKDTLGNVVKDGAYKMVIEFTSEHAQGPVQTVSFAKGAGAIRMNPVNQPFFVEMNLVYTPANATGIGTNQPFEFNVLQSARRHHLALEFRLATPEQITIDLYSPQGKLVQRLYRGNKGNGNHRIDANLASVTTLTKGNYMVVVTGDRLVATRRVVI